jgi:PAT family beta-lactamase induction signal transducer AmpG
VAADAIGWRDFFVLTVFTGIPGMWMLARFVPWGLREPEFDVVAPSWGAPLARKALLVRALAGAAVAFGAGLLTWGSLGGLSSLRAGRGFDVVTPMRAVLAPRGLGDWTTTAGLVILAAAGGLATAATLAARRGLASRS